jgi:hypothetical protein
MRLPLQLNILIYMDESTSECKVCHVFCIQMFDLRSTIYDVPIQNEAGCVVTILSFHMVIGNLASNFTLDFLTSFLLTFLRL